MLPIFNELTILYKLYKGKTPKSYIEPSDKSKSGLLLSALLGESEKNETQIAQKLGYKNEKDSGFKSLGNYLHSKMINFLFLLQPNDIFKETYIVEYFNCQKNLFLTKALFSLGMYGNAEKTALITLKIAI